MGGVKNKVDDTYCLGLHSTFNLSAGLTHFMILHKATKNLIRVKIYQAFYMSGYNANSEVAYGREAMLVSKSVIDYNIQKTKMRKN